MRAFGILILYSVVMFSAAAACMQVTDGWGVLFLWLLAGSSFVSGLVWYPIFKNLGQDEEDDQTEYAA